MSYDSPGSWANQACGLGLDGPVTGDDLDQMVAWYTQRCEPANVELPPPADPSLTSGLMARGFLLRAFENVFALEPDLRHTRVADEDLPNGVHWDLFDPSDDDAVREFAEMTTGAFEPRRQPDGTVPAMSETELGIMARVARHPLVETITARYGDQLVAVAGMEVRTLEPVPGGATETTCCIFGAVTHEDWRRCGLQMAMMQQRLAMARERGARVVTIGSRPGVPTERNARRCGFELAYTKVSMRRPLEM